MMPQMAVPRRIGGVTEKKSLFCMIHFKCIFIAFFNTLA